jgi:hypothetical protein
MKINGANSSISGGILHTSSGGMVLNGFFKVVNGTITTSQNED